MLATVLELLEGYATVWVDCATGLFSGDSVWDEGRDGAGTSSRFAAGARVRCRGEWF